MPTYTNKYIIVRVDSSTFSEDDHMVTFYGEHTIWDDEYGGSMPWTLKLESRFCRYQDKNYLLPELVFASEDDIKCLNESSSIFPCQESQSYKILARLVASGHRLSELKMYGRHTCYKMEDNGPCLVKKLVDDSLLKDSDDRCVTWDACRPIHVPSKSLISQFMQWVLP